MKGKRFVEEQITRILHEAETLDNVREVGRQPNTADKTCIADAGSSGARRACRVLALHCSTKRRQPDTDEEREVVARIHALSERYPRFRYRKIYVLPQSEHGRVSRETVRQIRQREGLQVVKRVRKTRPVGVRRY